ncbi:hypothetical protein C5167_001649 [Papaver somniferum]|uniref:Uncharacterized protein n=1 Tax=Papaver somniferum TaxID=3469 RepID=A0A4Y7KZH8_PAPSO|nr:hypothetical protein C5167_001649 [Papaver somniferum]
MKRNEVLAKEKMSCNEGPLEPKGFKLDFYSDENPYFNNAVPTKTYHVLDDDEIDGYKHVNGKPRNRGTICKTDSTNTVIRKISDTRYSI